MILHFPNKPPVRDEELASFAKAPVAEVSLGVQLDGLASYNSLHVASFFELIRSEFPNVEEHGPLDPAYETFGASSNPSSIVFQIPLPFPAGGMQAYQGHRFFFVSADGRRLIQLQKNRLHLNWRKLTGDEEYPRHPTLIEQFALVVDKHSKWCADNNLGLPSPTQWEIVYVNRFGLVAADGAQCGLSDYFPWLSGMEGWTEDGAIQYRHKLLNEDNEPVARLNTSLRYGTNSDESREAVLELLVRGAPPANASLRGCIPALTAGRNIIVNRFADMTSETAHDVWGRV
jgi:uncharacterized protein (TIGR04255 family)